MNAGKWKIVPSPREQERLTALGTMGLWSASGSYAFIIGRLLIGTCILTGATVEIKKKKKKIQDQTDQFRPDEVQADPRRRGKRRKQKPSLPFPHILILANLLHI